jgi:hypothetical protein
LTYNFDPDRWYEMHRAGIDADRASGRLDEAAFEEALARLDADYDRMIERLDGTYRLAVEADIALPDAASDRKGS